MKIKIRFGDEAAYRIAFHQIRITIPEFYFWKVQCLR